MKPHQRARASSGRHSPIPDHVHMSPYCGKRIRLPAGDYDVKEKNLRRFRRLEEILSGEAGKSIGEFVGVVNVGPDNDEIWVEKRLTEPEKQFVVIHELVHARRQMAGEDFPDDGVEERIVELEAVSRADPKVLGDMPNGLVYLLLHDFLTDHSRIGPNTKDGLARIHERIRTLLGGIKTVAC